MAKHILFLKEALSSSPSTVQLSQEMLDIPISKIGHNEYSRRSNIFGLHSEFYESESVRVEFSN